MATPIESFEDILEALERNPALRDALRRQILTEELLQMPAQVNALTEAVQVLVESQRRFEQGQEEIKSTVGRLEGGQEEIKETLASLGGNVSQLMGTNYEDHATKVARRYLFTQLGITGAQVFSSTRNAEPLNALADQALEEEVITLQERNRLDRTDAVFLGTDPAQGAQPVYVAAEVSITVQQDDVSRAIDRAALLGRITGTPAVPLVIGTRTAEGVDLRTARLVTVPTEEELQAAGQEGAQA